MVEICLLLTLFGFFRVSGFEQNKRIDFLSLSPTSRKLIIETLLEDITPMLIPKQYFEFLVMSKVVAHFAFFCTVKLPTEGKQIFLLLTNLPKVESCRLRIEPCGYGESEFQLSRKSEPSIYPGTFWDIRLFEKYI